MRSTPTDFLKRSGLINRSSIPWLRSHKLCPNLPRFLTKEITSVPRTSAQVSNPISCNRAKVTFPTPGILFNGNFKIKSSICSGVITYCPFGLFKSDAILARNLIGAIPAEAVRLSSAKICWRICCAINVAEP